MKKIAYIQGQTYNNEIIWESDSAESAAKGMRSLGYEVKLFKTEQIPELHIGPHDVLRGTVRACRTAFAHLGIPQPKNVDIPESLKKYVYRSIWETTIGELKKSGMIPFVKPLEYQKAFSGHIWGDYILIGNRMVNLRDEFPNNYKLLAQTPVLFGKEWRIYVRNQKILGIVPYRNLHLPNRLYLKDVKQMIRDYKDAPAGYALDVGYQHGKKQLTLVEVNEGFSIGNYGISHINFARVAEARWKELVS